MEVAPPNLTTNVATTHSDRVAEAIKTCAQKYSLPNNPAIDQDLLQYGLTPEHVSKKLAVLILCYKRDATTEELKAVSDQPAAQVRALRSDGFIFQGAGKDTGNFLFKDSSGATHRKIITFKQPPVRLRGRAEALVQKSVAACVSAIEIYNKPDFKYREETFSILLVNAWELLLKAKLLADSDNDIKVIQVLDSQGKAKVNRSGNSMTLDIRSAANQLAEQKKLDQRCQANIDLLIEIRDNSVHFLNKGADLTNRVQEIGTAGLRNYVTAMQDWFGRDLSRYNFYLMPMTFFYPENLAGFSTQSKAEGIKRLLKYFEMAEQSETADDGSGYAIALRIETKFVKTIDAADAISVKYTDQEGAPEIKVSEEQIIKTKYPLSYGELKAKLSSKYADFLANAKFHQLMKGFQQNPKLCTLRYLNPLSQKGSSQRFYSTQIIKEFDAHYMKK